MKRAAIATPHEFRDVLIAMARSACAVSRTQAVGR